MQSILDTMFLGNAARAWLRAGVVFVALFFSMPSSGRSCSTG